MRLGIPVVAAAAVLVLAGCSEPEPGSPLPTGGGAVTSAESSASPTVAPSTGSAPTSEPTETATAAPTPTAAPTLPPEATTNDAAGAEAFVEYWYEVANYAIVSGDTQSLRSVTDQACETCARIVESIDDQYDSGGLFRGGASSPSNVIAPAPMDGYVVVAFALDQEPPLAVNADGEVTNPGEAERPAVYLQMAIEREGEEWRALEIAQ